MLCDTKEWVEAAIVGPSAKGGNYIALNYVGDGHEFENPAAPRSAVQFRVRTTPPPSQSASPASRASLPSWSRASLPGWSRSRSPKQVFLPPGWERQQTLRASFSMLIAGTRCQRGIPHPHHMAMCAGFDGGCFCPSGPPGAKGEGCVSCRSGEKGCQAWRARVAFQDSVATKGEGSTLRHAKQLNGVGTLEPYLQKCTQSPPCLSTRWW